MTTAWIKCAVCFRETTTLNELGECELCQTMRVMAPVFAAINAGFAATAYQGGARENEVSEQKDTESYRLCPKAK